MKKNLLSFCLVLLTMGLSGQSSFFIHLKKTIHTIQPDIDLEDKIIAYNVWSISDNESREANKNFEKAYKTYEVAKLQGGTHGLIVVSINRENMSPEATITLRKDGITKLIPLKLEEVDLNNGAPKNMVFDTSGRVIYKDLESSLVYPSIHKLITR